MMIKKTTFILVLLAVLFSCKKDRLKNEKAILEGTWEWQYSLRIQSLTIPPFTSYIDTVFPSDVSSSYRIIFLKKGKVQTFENNELQNEYRTVFDKFQSEANSLIHNDSYSFEIDLDNEWNKFMNGCVNSDTLVLIVHPYFPFPDATYTNSTEDYIDFFKKVE